MIYALSLDELLDGLAVGGAGGGQQLEEGGLIGGEEDTLLFGPLQRHPVVGGLAAGEAVGNQIRLVAVGLQIHGGLEHTDVALDAAEQHINGSSFFKTCGDRAGEKDRKGLPGAFTG